MANCLCFFLCFFFLGGGSYIGIRKGMGLGFQKWGRGFKIQDSDKGIQDFRSGRSGKRFR